MLKYWIWLTTREGLSRRSVLRVLEYFGTPKAAMFADREEYKKIPGITQNDLLALEDKGLADAGRILDECDQAGLHVLTFGDAAYPQRLRQLEDAPAVLYWKGRLPAFDTLPVIGVVGTRKATAYGLQTAKRMGYQLGEGGGVVVSGMAKGIDGMATEGCLSAGQTAVGVLGCGADIVYPLDNRSLFRDTEERGCLLSEYVPGTEPKAEHFPVRNRLISGLSLGVLVVEAPARSGALITARHALDQGRDVFAIPGTIDTEAYEGSNGLIQQGAKLVTSGWDILSEYQHLFPDRLHQAGHGTTVKLTAHQLETSRTPAQKPRPDTGKRSAIRAIFQTKGPKEAGTVPADADKKEIDNAKNKPYSDLESVIAELSADERAIVYHLLEGPMQADVLTERTGLPAGQVLAAMTMLQVRGLVDQNAGKVYTLRAD